MGDERTVELYQSRDERRSLWATMLADGGMTLAGQELGASIAIFGEGLTEYEWAWTVAAEDVPLLPAAFGGKLGDDPIPLIRHWVRKGRGHDPGKHLEKSGFAVGFWSRMGD